MPPHLFLLFILAHSLLLFILAQPPPKCNEINFNEAPNLCRGIGTVKIPELWDPAFAKTFFAADSPSFNFLTKEPKTTILQIQPALEQIFTVDSLRTWGRTMFGCEDLTFLQGRWFRAMTCSALVSMSNSACKSSSVFICESNAKEFWVSWLQAAQNSVNKCPPNISDRVQSAFKMSGLAQGQLSDKNCFSATTIESMTNCGFPNANQACANSCTDEKFLKAQFKDAPAQPADLFCAKKVGEMNPKPNTSVKWLTTADFETSPLSAMVTKKNPQKSDPNSTQESSQDTDSWFAKGMETPVAGIQGWFWLIFGIIGAIIVVVISIMVLKYVRQRRQQNNLYANGFGNLPKSTPPKPPMKSNPNQRPHQTTESRSKEKSRSSTFNFNSIGLHLFNKKPEPTAARKSNTMQTRETLMNTTVQYYRPVAISYIPRMDDELRIHQGDTLGVWEEYGDGYAWGELNSGEQGVFPLMCLAPDHASPDDNTIVVPKAGVKDMFVRPPKHSYRMTAMTQESQYYHR